MFNFNKTSREEKVAEALSIQKEEVLGAINFSRVAFMGSISSIEEGVKLLDKFEDAKDSANYDLVLARVNEMANRELSYVNTAQAAEKLFHDLPDKCIIIEQAFVKWLSFVTTYTEAKEMLEKIDNNNPKKRLLILKAISLASNFDEADDIFSLTDADSAEEKIAMEKLLSFVTTIEQAQGIYESAGGDEAEKLAYQKYVSMVSSYSEAEDLFNMAPEEMEKAALSTWLSFAKTIDEFNDIYNNVSGEKAEKMVEAKLEELIKIKLDAITSLKELFELGSEVPERYANLFKNVIAAMIALITNKEEAEQVYALLRNDSELIDELEISVVSKWLQFVNNLEDAMEIWRTTSSSEEVEAIIKTKIDQLLSDKLKTINSFEAAVDFFEDNPLDDTFENPILEKLLSLASSIEQIKRVLELTNNTDDLSSLVFTKWLALASSAEELEDLRNNLSLSDQEEEEVTSKWFSLIKTLEEMQNFPLSEISEDSKVHEEFDLKLSKLCLEALHLAQNNLEKVKEIALQAPKESEAEKVCFEKWLSLVPNISEAEELFQAIDDNSDFDTLAVKKWLSLVTTLTEVKVLDSYKMNPEAEELYQRKWNELALEALRKVNSIKEAKRIFPDFPESGEARRELIKKVYELMG